jgi:hypothetical protein
VKIELRNIKYSAAMSEETHAFTAAIYIDGEKAGEAKNSGQGGGTMIWPHEVCDRLNAHAKTLPKRKFPEDLGGGEYDNNAETIIDDLVTDYLLRRDMLRSIKNKVLFTKKGKPGIFETRKLPPERIVQICGSGEEYARKLVVDADRVLNCMPEDEALAIYRTNGAQ